MEFIALNGGFQLFVPSFYPIFSIYCNRFFNVINCIGLGFVSQPFFETMRKKIKIRLKTVEADTLRYYLIYSKEKIKENTLRNGKRTAGENRLINTFDSFINQVNLTPKEEDQATQDAELIDHNYNTEKKN